MFENPNLSLACGGAKLDYLLSRSGSSYNKPARSLIMPKHQRQAEAKNPSIY